MEKTLVRLKFVFGRWSDVVIDAGHSDEVSAQVSLHLCSAPQRLLYCYCAPERNCQENFDHFGLQSS